MEKLIVWSKVDIPVGFTINFLLEYPLPPSTILISDKVFLVDKVWNFWSPYVLIVVKPTVLIPELKLDNEGYNWIVLELTIFA